MELTIENLYQLLDSTEYTEKELEKSHIDHSLLMKWETTFKILLDSFFPNYKINVINGFYRDYKGSIIHLESKYENCVFQNITELSFKSFYPNILLKLSKSEIENSHKDIDPYGEENWNDEKIFSEKLIWNIKEFPILFDFLLKNKDSITKYNNEKVNKLIKLLLNYTYGAINNRYSHFIECNNEDSIPSVGRKILTFFIDLYPNHIFYADTDVIYFSAFEEIEKDVFEKLKDIDLPYEIINHLYMYIMRKKTYMMIDSEDVKFMGFNHFKIIKNLREHQIKREELFRNNRIKAEERELEIQNNITVVGFEDDWEYPI